MTVRPALILLLVLITRVVSGQDGYSYTELQNPDDFDQPAAIYKKDNVHRSDISAILRHIGFEDGIPEGVTVTIYERPTFYEIEEMSDYSASIYKMRKSTWTIYDSVHEDLAVEEDDPTTEVK